MRKAAPCPGLKPIATNGSADGRTSTGTIGEKTARGQELMDLAADHRPKPQTAQPCSAMSYMTTKTMQLEKELGPVEAGQNGRPAEEQLLPTLGPFRYKDGSTYTGQYRFGLRHGRGRQVFEDGVYDGWWKDDLYHGPGKLIQNEDDVFIGSFANGKKHGRGSLTVPDKVDDWHLYYGHAHVGEFKDGQLHGRGISDLGPQGRVAGSYVQGSLSGYGEWRSSDGEVYRGYFKNSNRHGPGLLISPTGETKKGIWRDGQMIEEKQE